MTAFEFMPLIIATVTLATVSFLRARKVLLLATALWIFALIFVFYINFNL